MTNLVSTDWLADHLNDDDVAVLDATWLLPPLKRNARAEFEACHIPGAQFFDLDAISDQQSALPHMLPTPESFADSVGRLGIGSHTRVICYDSLGIFSAARCWWMFKVFGHDAVSVLDGGLKKWLAEERTTQDGPASIPAVKSFTPAFRPEMVRSLEEVAAGGAQIVDARSGPRFRGEEEEPRPGVRKGHIPGALNLHYGAVVNADGTFIAPTRFAELLHQAGIDPSKPLVTSCGSGGYGRHIDAGPHRDRCQDPRAL